MKKSKNFSSLYLSFVCCCLDIYQNGLVPRNLLCYEELMVAWQKFWGIGSTETFTLSMILDFQSTKFLSLLFLFTRHLEHLKSSYRGLF